MRARDLDITIMLDLFIPTLICSTCSSRLSLRSLTLDAMTILI